MAIILISVDQKTWPSTTIDPDSREPLLKISIVIVFGKNWVGFQLDIRDDINHNQQNDLKQR